MPQPLHTTAPVIDILLGIPEREWKEYERAVCIRGVQRMQHFAEVSAHLREVANHLQEAAKAEEREAEKQYLLAEAARWAEMARKADLLARRKVKSAKKAPA